MLTATAYAQEVDGEYNAPQAGEFPVDLQHLRRFTFGDRGLEKEVLELFLAQLPHTIAALSSACNERDWRIAAHTLKGSGRAVGAWQIAGLAEEAERLADARSRTTASQTVARIEQAASEARSFIVSQYGVA